ncbi:MAG: NUDIX domain-containing protein [Gammaproteobacteria bacterium]|nr:NUDIX domain-containing protein [Gammaproteobacteria bacterium]
MASIPPHARRVFQGILFDVYQWEQELFDGSTTTFEAIHRLPSVQIIATTPEDGIILLMEEQPFVGEFISVPGGRVERDHGPEETARRELLEELGMTAETWTPWRTTHRGGTIQYQSHDFIARRCRRVRPPEQEPGERIQPFVVGLGQFLDLAADTRFRNKGLSDYLNHLRHTPGAVEKLRRELFG